MDLKKKVLSAVYRLSNYPIEKPEDADRLIEGEVPGPCEVGVTKEILRRYEYIYDWFPKGLEGGVRVCGRLDILPGSA